MSVFFPDRRCDADCEIICIILVNSSEKIKLTDWWPNLFQQWNVYIIPFYGAYVSFNYSFNNLLISCCLKLVCTVEMHWTNMNVVTAINIVWHISFPQKINSSCLYINLAHIWYQFWSKKKSILYHNVLSCWEHL